MAGLVRGVESVPDGLASGLLAGVNPVAGLYGYLFGMLGGACFTGTAFMSVQATGAIIVADVDLAGREDPAKSLFTLSVVTGIVIHIWELDLATTTVGVVTIVLIVVLGRTPLGSLGLFVAVLAGSVLGRVGRCVRFRRPVAQRHHRRAPIAASAHDAGLRGR